MRKKRILITGLCLIIIAPSGSGLQASRRRLDMQQNRVSQSTVSDEQLVREVIKLLDDCPAWSDLIDDDRLTQKAILECYSKISKYDLTIIRMSIVKYFNDKRRANSYSVACMSRLYILNRYIFNVPTSALLDRRTFGGWGGVPWNGHEINWLWPLSFDSKGNIELTGRFKGYNGHDYLAIQEFDYFNQTFGPRKLPSNK